MTTYQLLQGDCLGEMPYRWDETRIQQEVNRLYSMGHIESYEGAVAVMELLRKMQAHVEYTARHDERELLRMAGLLGGAN